MEQIEQKLQFIFQVSKGGKVKPMPNKNLLKLKKEGGVCNGGKVKPKLNKNLLKLKKEGGPLRGPLSFFNLP